jgi:putative FmdB family regulatory protein
MPIYEYICSDCRTVFSELRTMQQADEPIACEKCGGSHTARKISLFAAHSEGRVVAGSNGGCTSCSGGTCTTCGI